MCKVEVIVNGIKKTIEISKPLKGKDRLVQNNGKWYVLRQS